MVDEYDDDDLDDDSGDEQQEESEGVANLRRKLNAERRKMKELSKQAEMGLVATKRLALLDAKLPDTPQVKFFLDHYDGEYSPEAIKAKAAEYGFITADKEVTDEVNAVEALMSTGHGATSTSPGTDEAMLDEIAAVTATGQAASKQIEQIMRRYGRYQDDE